jgi:hypothetical protein
MRILVAAIVAAFFAAGSVAAYAQDAEPAPAPMAKPVKVNCKKLDEEACTATPACTWTAKGKCIKAKKKKKK